MTNVRYISQSIRVKLVPMLLSSEYEFKLQRKKWYGWKTTSTAVARFHTDQTLPELLNMLYEREKAGAMATDPFYEQSLKILNQKL